MESLILAILPFFFVTLMASHDVGSTSEIYWKTVLGNTPMPESIKHILPRAGNEEINGAAKAYKTSRKQVSSMFFQEKDLKTGLKLNILFTEPTYDESTTTFLPREVAERIPFSSKKLSQILEHFSVEPDSLEAKLIDHTLFACAYKEKEDKYCATSLESMIDYATSRFGRNVKVVTTELPKGSKSPYSVVEVKSLGRGEFVIDCHKSNYPYAVFYCHLPVGTKPYILSLVDANGKSFQAMITCHPLGHWNFRWWPYKVPEVRAGMCHFLDTDDILWVRS